MQNVNLNDTLMLDFSIKEKLHKRKQIKKQNKKIRIIVTLLILLSLVLICFLYIKIQQKKSLENQPVLAKEFPLKAQDLVIAPKQYSVEEITSIIENANIKKTSSIGHYIYSRIIIYFYTVSPSSEFEHFEWFYNVYLKNYRKRIIELEELGNNNTKDTIIDFFQISEKLINKFIETYKKVNIESNEKMNYLVQILSDIKNNLGEGLMKR